MEKLRVLDLFSGIGGFSLGLERAGMETVAFCEIDPYCRAVLRKHWPGVPIHDDVTELDGRQYRGTVDVICGGFPCQDISVAGAGAGIRGERSGLWSEYSRLIGEVRPRYVIVENVAALLARGMGVVLGDLSTLGYDAEWHCIPAAAVGAPHRRDRVWIIAYPNSSAVRDGTEWDTRGRLDFQGLGLAELGHDGSIWNVAYSDGSERGAIGGACDPEGGDLLRREREKGATGPGASGEDVAHPDSQRELQSEGREQTIWGRPSNGSESLPDASGERLEGHGGSVRVQAEHPHDSIASWWLTEPDVGRMAHGIPSRVDRLRSLGNAVVPQVVEVIGRAIVDAA